MSVVAGKYIEIEFANAEITNVYGHLPYTMMRLQAHQRP